jgi:hypothetical protein
MSVVEENASVCLALSAVAFDALNVGESFALGSDGAEFARDASVRRRPL